MKAKNIFYFSAVILLSLPAMAEENNCKLDPSGTYDCSDQPSFSNMDVYMSTLTATIGSGYALLTLSPVMDKNEKIRQAVIAGSPRAAAHVAKFKQNIFELEESLKQARDNASYLEQKHYYAAHPEKVKMNFDVYVTGGPPDKAAIHEMAVELEKAKIKVTQLEGKLLLEQENYKKFLLKELPDFRKAILSNAAEEGLNRAAAAQIKSLQRQRAWGTLLGPVAGGAIAVGGVAGAVLVNDFRRKMDLKVSPQIPAATNAPLANSAE